MGCNTKAPKPPKTDLLSPNISKQSCLKYTLNESKNSWELVSVSDIQSCNGILGVTREDYVILDKYRVELTNWIENNCGPKSNR